MSSETKTTTPVENLSEEDFKEVKVVKQPRAAAGRFSKDRIIANFKRRYTYRWLPFDQLKIDRSYQRRLQPRRSSSMAHNWNTDKENALVVNRRVNGTYFIVDGQHTYEALSAIENHPPRVYCKVFTGLTLEEEAQLFHDLDNERENLTPGASFKALVVAKDPAALEITRVAESVGLTVNYDRGPVPGNVRAFKSLQDIYRRGGSKGLERILRICHSAWPNNNDSTSSTLMRGLEIFLNQYGNKMDEHRLIETLSKHQPGAVVNMARNIDATLSSTIYPATAMAIKVIYNKKLTRNRLD